MNAINAIPAIWRNGIAIIATIMLTCTLANANEVDYRLPKTYNVTYQHIELSLDPDVDDFSGQTQLSLEVKQDIEVLGLHWIGLTIEKMVLENQQSSRQLKAKDGQYDMHWLGDGNAISKGKYTLHITFSGQYSNDALGLYKSTFQGKNYLFTQFENNLARRVFPLVDEPDTKIPYQLTLTVPKDLKVAANTPVETEHSDEKSKTIRYEATPPMPSYLIALTVGDFDVTPIKGLSIPGVVYSTKGTGVDTGFAIKHTPEILQALESYFGMPYPYKKLDFVAVPDFAFGAMENVGLVTYRSELLLLGDTATAGEAQSSLNVIAHELAHMWYGNLVTMEWWNDLWLNEAFASWMAQRVVETLYPDLQSELSLPQAYAYGEDALPATKPITKEVKTEEDVQDGLGLNYTKGHSILNMLEQSVGRQKFQKAIQQYMQKHKWSNTIAKDLWDAVSEHASYDVAAVAKTFLDQPGYPLISIDDRGVITQNRYRYEGNEVAEQSWQVPLSVKYKQNGQIHEELVLLKDNAMTLSKFAEVDWVLPTANGNGYYIWQVGEKHLANLIKDIDSLTNREKTALLTNSSMLLPAAKTTLFEHLTLLTEMTKEDNPVVFLAVLEDIKQIGENYVTESNIAQFRRYVTKVMTPWFNKIGSQTRASDSEGVLKLRPRLIRTLGQFGNNEKLNQEVYEMALTYLSHPETIDGNLGREALRMAAMMDDGKLAKTYFDTYINSANASLKSNIMGSMYFTDKASIEYVFDMVISDKIPAGDKNGPMSGLFYINRDHSFLYEVLSKKFDAILNAIPSIYKGYMPYVTSPGCSQRNMDMHQAFYAEKGEEFAVALKKAQQSANSCVTTKARGTEPFEQFLEPYKASM